MLRCNGSQKERPGPPLAGRSVRYMDKKREIPWKSVYRVAGHVYHSHRTHAADAKLVCETCHGPAGSAEKGADPPALADNDGYVHRLPPQDAGGNSPERDKRERRERERKKIRPLRDDRLQRLPQVRVR